MFNSTKEPGSKKNWVIQILTTEYLIDGSVPESEYNVAGMNAFASARQVEAEDGGIRAFQTMSWTAGQMQPTGNLLLPAQSFSKCTLAAAINVVAVIPNDDTSRLAAQKAYKNCKYPVNAVIYAGPYCIRGTILSDRAGDASSSLYDEWSLLPVQQAEIESLLPGAAFAGLQVPWLLVNIGLIHCFVFPKMEST